jgi:hypothetical protein
MRMIPAGNRGIKNAQSHNCYFSPINRPVFAVGVHRRNGRSNQPKVMAIEFSISDLPLVGKISLARSLGLRDTPNLAELPIGKA